MHEFLATVPVIETRGLEEARDAVTRIYLPHELFGHDDVLDMRLNAVTDRRLTLGYLTYQAEVELVMPPTEDCYHVNLTTVGRTRATRTDGRREVTSALERGAVLSPVQTNRVHWDADAEQLILKIPRVSLESHLSDVLGTPVAEVLDFDFGLDLRDQQGQALLRAVEFLATEVGRPGGLAQMPLAREHLESYVLTTLLHAGRHQFSDALVRSEDTRRVGRMSEVLDWIDANAAEVITPEVLARVANVSLRTLHSAFRKHVGESPMAYVRRVRLERVRAELLRTDPERYGVADVSMRWGFYHQSRFAQQYQQRFHELPSVTLHR